MTRPRSRASFQVTADQTTRAGVTLTGTANWDRQVLYFTVK